MKFSKIVLVVLTIASILSWINANLDTHNNKLTIEESKKIKE